MAPNVFYRCVYHLFQVPLLSFHSIFLILVKVTFSSSDSILDLVGLGILFQLTSWVRQWSRVWLPVYRFGSCLMGVVEQSRCCLHTNLLMIKLHELVQGFLGSVKQSPRCCTLAWYKKFTSSCERFRFELKRFWTITLLSSRQPAFN